MISCDYRKGAQITDRGTKKSQYAALLTGFVGHSRLALVVADSGCDSTLVSEDFIKDMVTHCQRMKIEPTTIRGISNGVVATERAAFDLLIPARSEDQGVLCRIRIEGFVIPDMKIGLLVGTDNMKPERMVVDLDRGRVTFNGHKGAYSPLHPVRQSARPVVHRVVATESRAIAPGQDALIPFWRRGVKPGYLEDGKDYLFEPCHSKLPLYAALVSAETRHVVVRNHTRHIYHLEKGELLGTIVELPSYHAMVAGVGDPLLALDASEGTFPNSSTLDPDTDQPRRVLSNGVTIAGKEAEQRDLESIVNEFKQLWVNDGTPVDIPMKYWMTVPLKEGAEFPKKVRAYPMSPAEREIIEKTLQKLHDEGKVSWSKGHTPSAYPVFVTYREIEKDGEFIRKPRVVVDIRKLNEITEPDVYPVQQQEDLMLRIGGKKYLSVFDAASFFYQWLIHPAHRQRMAVISHRGQETFNVAIMGYINSIAYVARQMANILRGCEDFCVTYVDDIVVYSATYEDHLFHLRIVLNRLRGYNITLSPEKTFLGFNSVTVLGQRVSSLGMTTTAERIHSLMAWKFPRNHKELERYLGAVGYLRRYIPRFSQIVKPLEDYKTLLLKDSPSLGGPKRKNYSLRRELLEAGPAEKEAFAQLQAIISKGLFLYHQDVTKPLLVNVDASKEYGFGAMVYQAREDWAGYANNDFSTPPPRSKTLPIMFLSRGLQGGEVRFHPTDMELACIVWVLRKIKVYVELSPKTIFYTDHASNTYIAHQSVQQASMGGYNMRLTLGAVLIRSFRNVEVKYIRGKDNIMADALSRNPGDYEDDGIPSTTDPTGCTLEPLTEHVFVATRSQAKRKTSGGPAKGSIPVSSSQKGQKRSNFEIRISPTSGSHQRIEVPISTAIREDRKSASVEVLVSEDIKEKARQGYQGDPKWKNLIEDLTARKGKADTTGRKMPELPFYLDADGLLWQRFPHLRLCVPSSMEKEILELCHTPIHLGYHKALQRLKPFCLIRGAARLRAYVRACPVCLQNRTRRHRPYGELQPIMEPFIPFHTICIDIVTGLPEGLYNAFMSVTDKATKRCMFIPGKHNWDATQWGDALDVRLAEGDWGTPRKIISDRDPRFVGAIWKTMWKNRQVQLAYTTAYHAQADGQSEMTNQVAEIALRNWLTRLRSPYQWHLTLPYIQSVLNSSVHATTKTTPHKLMYGVEVPSGFGPLTDKMQDGLSHEGERYDASIAVADAMMTMARHYDKRHLPVNLKPGSRVMLRLHKGYNIPSTKAFPKVSAQYAGPFRVVRQVTPLAFELDLPATMKVHPVVSVAHLDPVQDDYDPFGRDPAPVLPVKMEDGTGDSWEIETLLDRRDVIRRGRTSREYLVRWKGFGPEEDRWYSVEDLQQAQELMKEFDENLEQDRKGQRSLARLTRQASAAELDHNQLEETLAAMCTTHEPRRYVYTS